MISNSFEANNTSSFAELQAYKSDEIADLPVILVLDDEERILSSLRRQLRGLFEVSTYSNPADALLAVSSGREFEVILCDQQMPGMTGTEFLKRLDVISPQAVRIMLTGNSDQQTPVEAVNAAKVFRFLNKPCPAERLIAAIDDGVEEYRRRELLNSTAASANTAEIARTEILHNMGHELRTPLNHILGFSELLRSTELEPDQVKEYADIIYGSGENLLNEINNLLDLATIRAGAMEVVRSPVSCDALLDFARDYVERNYGDRDIRFSSTTYGDFQTLEIDGRLFKTALRAVLANAGTFNPNGTTVYMATRTAEGRAAACPRYC